MVPKIRCVAVALALVASQFAIPADAQDRVRFEFEANLWDPDASGSIRIIEQNIGATIDLESDLGLVGDEISDLRLTFHPSRRTEIRLTQVPLSYSGDQIVSRTLEFAGEVFTVSTRVVSVLDLDYFRAGFAWQFLASDDNRFRFGPLLEIKGFDGAASLAAPDLGAPISVSEEFEVAFGSAGVALDLEPTDRIHIFGEFSVLVGSDEGDQTEFEAGIRVQISGPLGVQAGFRSIELDFEDENDMIDLDIDGVFFGASLRF